ncbi:MAG: TetR family transcriptional regulator [Gordonia sp. (in: high G+C Gram-positive bacteria)]
MSTLYASGLFQTRGARGDTSVPHQAAKLTASAIVTAAIDVADRDGLDALSMRRLADELGVGAMSLYRHVADKEALLAGMAAEVGRRYPYPVHELPDWRTRVDIAVRIDWDLYRRHPWVVLAYSAPRYSFGVVALEGLDWLAAGFTQLGVGVSRAVEMTLTLWAFVNGAALAAVSEELLHADSPGTHPGGLADLITGRLDADLTHLPTLSTLFGDSAAAGLVDPQAALATGVDILCAGFSACAPR